MYGWSITTCQAVYENDNWRHNIFRTQIIHTRSKRKPPAPDNLKPAMEYEVFGVKMRVSDERIYSVLLIGKAVRRVHYDYIREKVKP